MEVEKDNTSQKMQGAFSALGGPPQGLDEAIQQKSCFLTLKEFQKQGIKKLKVISQRGLEELINLVVEGELKRRLDNERESRVALEEEVIRLRKELESIQRKEDAGFAGFKGDWRGKLREIVSDSLKRAREDMGEKDLPIEFIRKLEEGLLRVLDGGMQPEPSGVLINRPKVEQGVGPVKKGGGGLFNNILKDNLKLRGVNQGVSST